MRKTNKVVIEAIVNEHPYKVLTDDEFFLLWKKARRLNGFTTFSKSKLQARLSESGIIETVFMSNEKKIVSLDRGYFYPGLRDSLILGSASNF